MIQDYENSLRSIISKIIGEDDTVDLKVTPERISIWKERREIEKRKFNGVLVENRIIYYSDFYDLENIILKNWDSFRTIFDDKKRFEVFFKEVENFRNTVAHNRALMPFQEKMLESIVVDLKTKIMIYHNKNETADDYFIRIIKVSDSIGNVLNYSKYTAYLITEKTLRVGDMIEFYTEAFDPKGGLIFYKLSNRSGVIETNNTGKFVLTIKKEWVTEHCVFDISAFTKDREYLNEKIASLFYTVIPSQ